MPRKLSRVLLQAIHFVSIAITAIVTLAGTSFAQNAFDKGTPAESKGGISSLSTYAQDKLETVNLANGNLNVHIPLVTIGGRGSASYTLTLNYNSKVWTSQHDVEPEPVPQGQPGGKIDHYTATFNDLGGRSPNFIMLGGGWSLPKAPALKVTRAYIQTLPQSSCANVLEGTLYKYLLTKLSLVLADGSEVQMRDDLTDGAPYQLADPCGLQIDRNRGRVWHSVDGSAITYVSDVDNGVVTGQLSGYVFLADGTRMRMSSTGRCTKIIDQNGNQMGINYIPSTGSVIYTDELGREVVLQPTANGAAVTIKGYNGTADRTFTIVTGQVAPDNNVSAAPNLRVDFQNTTLWPRPFTSGDLTHTFEGGINQHAEYGSTPHTDLIYRADPDPSAINNSDIYAGETEMSLVYVVTELDLLDGRSFRFRYNPWGELAEIVYPGGGVSRIDYSAVGSARCEAPLLNPMLNRQVVQRRTYSDGVNLDATWTYTRTSASPNPYVTVEARQGGTSALMLSEKHFFLALDADYSFGVSCANGTHNEKFENAKEIRVERLAGSGTQIETRSWSQRAAQTWGLDPGQSINNYAQEWGQEQGPNDDRQTLEDTTLENGKLKRVRYDYDDFNNVTRLREYDFGPGAQGTLVRDTTRTYLSNQNGYCYTNLNGVDGSCGGALYNDPAQAIHRRRLLLDETVKDGSGNVEAHSEFEYDNYLGDGSHAPIQINAGMIQYDGTWFSPFAFQSQPRGNVTRVKRLISGSPPPSSGTYATSYSQYDEAGNVVKTIDPRGNATTGSYQDNFGDGSNPDFGASGTNGATYAFATSATNALGHVVKTQHDYTRGVMTGIKDANGTITRSEYNDPYDRPNRVTAAYGLPEATKTEMSYPTGTANQTTISKQLDSTRWIAYKTTYDGFGRPLTANEAEDGNHASVASFTIFSKRIYDGLGRPIQSSNPFRSGDAVLFTTMAYDLAGRIMSVTTPDNAVVSTSYNGNETTVTDQAGKARKSITDGLGRLAQVIEDPLGLGYITAYGYDARGNLKTVTQGTQPQRTFSYDLLSRLTQANNPESGTVSYQYDANSNLISKTDTRLITTTYNYDALNRVTSRSYSDTTPTVSYAYDGVGVPFSKGRLTSVSSTVSSYSYGQYDAFGRVKTGTQTTSGQGYAMSYAYDLAGNMTSETYPSGRTVTTSYDGAGRVNAVNGQKTGESSKTYASTFAYTAHDAVASMLLGNGKVEHTSFNSRLQPTLIGLGTSTTDSSTLKLDYTYGSTSNNGNVQSQTITVGATVMSQSYGYDSLNRLQTASENSGANWSQTYGYDRYGNRWVSASTGYTLSSLTPTSSGAFNTANNRIMLSGFGYDAAGNLTSDPRTPLNGIVYDAENRQTSFNGSVGQYSYDGDGRRVKKIDSSGTTIFVYNAGGQLIAEYHSDPAPAAAGGGGTSYLTSDHLGSTRVVTKQDGTVKARYDYLPFGEELPSSVGGRSSVVGYGGADSTKQKFTQKERDNESGLDYFLARYYSSAQGRFTSPDKPFVNQLENDPQTWNLYMYARSNPLLYVDPTGEDYVLYQYDKDGKVINTYQVRDIAALGKGYKVTGGNEDGSILYVQGPNGASFTAQYIAGDPGGVTVQAQYTISALGNGVGAELDRSAQGSRNLIGGFAAVTAAGGAIAGAAAYVAPAALPFIVRAVEKVSVTGPSIAVTLLSKAQDPKLRNIIDNLYRLTAKIGSGSSADAFRADGSHAQKLADSIRGLQNVLKNPNLSQSDREIVNYLINDMKNALSGK